MQIIGKKEYQQKERTVLIRARHDKKNEAHSNTSNALKKHTQETRVAAHSKCQQRHRRKNQIGSHRLPLCMYMHTHEQGIPKKYWFYMV